MHCTCIFLVSFRNTSKALERFREKRSHVAVWNWVERFNPRLSTQEREE